MAELERHPRSTRERYDGSLLICTACGTEFDQLAEKPLDGCVICDDPRQYVPPSGQSWTSHGELLQTHHNVFTSIDGDENLWSIVTQPKLAIGQRCVLIRTPHGNVLWDCITLLDQPTIDFIKSNGGLKAIVISHPHYYTRHLAWAATFECPVYVSAEDEEWTQQRDPTKHRQFLGTGSHDVEIVPGVHALKLGGHFPGSLVLIWQDHLFVADTLVTVPSALYAQNRPKGTTSYAYMWSIPNMIPLPPATLMQMWKRLGLINPKATHGAFKGQEIRASDGGGPIMARILESMKIQVRASGWSEEEAKKAVQEGRTGWEEPEILRQKWP